MLLKNIHILLIRIQALLLLLLFKFASCDQRSSDLELISSYSNGGEEGRLFEPAQIVERLRTESILKRYAPQPPAVVYDIGGGAGAYAFPLTQQGYSVHLTDFVPLHIQQAQAKMQETGIQLAECSVGDARDIKANDAVADIVLFFGPLYHLEEKQDRLKALHEAYRILKPGGTFFAVAMARIGVVHLLGNKNKLHDPYFASIVETTLKTGKYKAPKAKFFTSAYCHHSDEFEKEIEMAGFKNIQLLNINGQVHSPILLDEILKNQQALDTWLYFLELIEKDRTAMDTAHIMAIGKK